MRGVFILLTDIYLLRDFLGLLSIAIFFGSGKAFNGYTTYRFVCTFQMQALLLFHNTIRICSDTIEVERKVIFLVYEKICELRACLSKTRSELRRAKKSVKSLAGNGSDEEYGDKLFKQYKAETAYKRAKETFDEYIFVYAEINDMHRKNTCIFIETSEYESPVIHIFFGGKKGSPNGPSHGHYVLNFYGEFLYHKECGKKNSSQKNRMKKWSRPYSSVPKISNQEYVKKNCSQKERVTKYYNSQKLSSLKCS